MLYVTEWWGSLRSRPVDATDALSRSASNAAEPKVIHD